MTANGSRVIDRLAAWVHHRLLLVIVGAYALAVVAPGPGLAVKGCRPAFDLPLPGLLLGGLLFVAGLGADPRHLRGLTRRPGVLALGLAATVVVPVLFVLAAATALRGWHNPAEAAAAVTGLALIAALPVAGSSAAWTQTADGDLAVSLGLILGSTLLSPITTPAALSAAGWAVGPAADELSALVAGGADGFLVRFVAVPSAAGLAVRAVLGTARYERARSGLKLLTAAVLAVLCYANAAAVLPGTVAQPDWDFLLLTGVAVVGLCGTGFAAGWGLGRALGLGGPQRTALMYGLGMTNNGTGLALAASALTVPGAVLPVLVCNLTQHLVAAAVRPRGSACR